MRIATRTRTTALAALALVAARTASAERRFCTLHYAFLQVDSFSPQKLTLGARFPALPTDAVRFASLPPAFLFAAAFTNYET